MVQVAWGSIFGDRFVYFTQIFILDAFLADMDSTFREQGCGPGTLM